MPLPLNLMVFSDLDGTLIDHDTYVWDAAQDALTKLRSLSAAVVLASSKTAAEMIDIRAALGLEDWPAIVENGAGLLNAHDTAAPDASAYTDIRAILKGLPDDLRQPFCGFGDMSTQQLCDATGLNDTAAQRAQNRCFSEPGIWSGTADDKDRFLAALATYGVSAQQGGRFLTLSFGKNKVDQMRDVIKTYQPCHTVALGDAPNDSAMLEHADFGVIVANPHRPPLPALKGEAQGRITRTKATGPAGWNTAILTLIDQLDLQ